MTCTCGPIFCNPFFLRDTVAGGLFSLTIKLNLESGDRVHFQQARINHRALGGLRLGSRETGRINEGFRKVLQGFSDWDCSFAVLCIFQV